MYEGRSALHPTCRRSHDAAAVTGLLTTGSAQMTSRSDQMRARPCWTKGLYCRSAKGRVLTAMWKGSGLLHRVRSPQKRACASTAIRRARAWDPTAVQPGGLGFCKPACLCPATTWRLQRPCRLSRRHGGLYSGFWPSFWLPGC